MSELEINNPTKEIPDALKAEPIVDTDKKEEEAWTKEYDKWLNQNSHLPDTKTAKEILDMPRPKTAPPNPPQPDATDEQIAAWVKGYDKWKEENSHLDGLIPSEALVQRFKQQRDMMKNQAQGLPPAQPVGSYKPDEPSMNINQSFYYQVENGRKVEIHADDTYINNLRQQYYVRESDGSLTKVIGDPIYAQRIQKVVEKKNLDEAQAQANSQ